MVNRLFSQQYWELFILFDSVRVCMCRWCMELEAVNSKKDVLVTVSSLRLIENWTDAKVDCKLKPLFPIDIQLGQKLLASQKQCTLYSNFLFIQQNQMNVCSNSNKWPATDWIFFHLSHIPHRFYLSLTLRISYCLFGALLFLSPFFSGNILSLPLALYVSCFF